MDVCGGGRVLEFISVVMHAFCGHACFLGAVPSALILGGEDCS